MFLTQDIGVIMAEGIKDGLALGVDIFLQGLVDFAKQNPILAVAVVLIILFGGKLTSKKRR